MKEVKHNQIYRVKRAEPEELYPIRSEVLRPGREMAECIFPGDEDASTVHLLALSDDGEAAGIVSLYRVALRDVNAMKPYQLRGMATRAIFRGTGCGTTLLGAALDVCRGQGADLVWCNARESAVSFYARAGFYGRGETFEIPNIGPHRKMCLSLLQ